MRRRRGDNGTSQRRRTSGSALFLGCSLGRAGQVAAMLQNTLKVNLDGQYLDATDALAAAVCHYYQSRSPFGGAGKKYNDWGAFLKENPNRGK